MRLSMKPNTIIQYTVEKHKGDIQSYHAYYTDFTSAARSLRIARYYDIAIGYVIVPIFR